MQVAASNEEKYIGSLLYLSACPDARPRPPVIEGNRILTTAFDIFTGSGRAIIILNLSHGAEWSGCATHDSHLLIYSFIAVNTPGRESKC